ncbi:MAG: squalene synthase HpnC [Alphaproteobacteria bacterium]|nr:squalene synthase HpnC [Alphaproteobacteria bacterium]
MAEKIKRTKDANGENFPVGSRLIPAKLRPHVMAFYDFARTADDIADSTQINTAEKLERLNNLEKVLLGETEANDETRCAAALKKSLEETKVTNQHALDLLKAFRQDSEGHTYHSWEDIMAYCRWSAGSVGRYMLDLHEENPTAYWPSDALCAALQMNNHLQDCKEDFQEKHRIYLPLDWFKEEQITYEALGDKEACSALKAVFARVTDGIESLLVEGSSLPLVTVNRGLRMEVCLIFRLAQRLVKRLKKSDPLKHKVKLTKSDWIIAAILGVCGGLRRKKISCIRKKDLKPPKK